MYAEKRRAYARINHFSGMYLVSAKDIMKSKEKIVFHYVRFIAAGHSKWLDE